MARKRNTTAFTHHRDLRYGENPHQQPSMQLIVLPEADDPLALHRFSQTEGEDPSYINVTDLDRLVEYLVRIAAGYEANFGGPFRSAVVVIVKHGNVCGAAVRELPEDAEAQSKARIDAIEAAVRGNPRAAFGGAVLTNFALGEEEANALRFTEWHDEHAPKGRPFDLVVAPKIVSDAFVVLKRPRGKCRMFENEHLTQVGLASMRTGRHLRQVRGGWLSQPFPRFVLRLDDEDMRIRGDVARIAPKAKDLVLAWALGSASNSNAVTVVHKQSLKANGAGTVDRVGACEQASRQLDWKKEHGMVAYSDSFFPFSDGLHMLWYAGVRTVLTTYGSLKDEHVAEYVEKNEMTLLWLPDTMARGFSGH